MYPHTWTKKDSYGAIRLLCWVLSPIGIFLCPSVRIHANEPNPAVVWMTAPPAKSLNPIWSKNPHVPWSDDPIFDVLSLPTDVYRDYCSFDDRSFCRETEFKRLYYPCCLLEPADLLPCLPLDMGRRIFGYLPLSKCEDACQWTESSCRVDDCSASEINL